MRMSAFSPKRTASRPIGLRCSKGSAHGLGFVWALYTRHFVRAAGGCSRPDRGEAEKVAEHGAATIADERRGIIANRGSGDDADPDRSENGIDVPVRGGFGEAINCWNDEQESAGQHRSSHQRVNIEGGIKNAVHPRRCR